MTPAHLPVFGAIACTMFFNGSYAYTNAEAAENKLAMVALALTIDLAKCSFLPAAAHLRTQGRLFGPILLVLLWIPALAYSTFSGYAYLLTTRASAHVGAHASADERIRADHTYRNATADLAAAKTDPLWQKTAACTRTPSTRERSFCTNVGTIGSRLAAAEAVLNRVPPREAQPEIARLVSTTGWTAPSLGFLVALFPAVLIELVAGLGLYALRSSPKPLERAEEALQAPAGYPQSPAPQNPPSGILGGFDDVSAKPRWKVAGAP